MKHIQYTHEIILQSGFTNTNYHSPTLQPYIRGCVHMKEAIHVFAAYDQLQE